MRLLTPFFSINSKISMDLIIKLNIEQDTKKLFEAIVADGGKEVDIRPGLMRALRLPMFYDVPKIMYYMYTFSPREGSIYDQAMSKLKGKKTGVQPHYHEKHMVTRQVRFAGILNSDNAGREFEWIIVSIIPVSSKEHRNTCSVYINEKATHMIQKITLTNMKDSTGLYISTVYNLTEFEDQLSLYRQFCTYVSNKPSTSTMLDFSNYQEIQDTVERIIFFHKSVFKKVIYQRERFSVCNRKKRLIETERRVNQGRNFTISGCSIRLRHHR